MRCGVLRDPGRCRQGLIEMGRVGHDPRGTATVRARLHPERQPQVIEVKDQIQWRHRAMPRMSTASMIMDKRTIVKLSGLSNKGIGKFMPMMPATSADGNRTADAPRIVHGVRSERDGVGISTTTNGGG